MSMFWGLSVKPNRKYTQTIVKSFHISGAALDEGDKAKLYITADKSKFILGTLNQNIPQIPLDLNFCKGDKIMFQTTGNAQISLTGYLHDADESDDEYEEEELIGSSNALKKKGAKGIEMEDASEEEDEDEDDDDDEDDEDDEDDSKLVAEYSSFLEAESGEEEGDEEEDEEDESDDEDEDEDQEDDKAPKAKKRKLGNDAKTPAKEQNGAAKKSEKQQQQQQKSKKDKKSSVAAEVKKEQPKPKESKQVSAERSITGGVKILDLHNGNGPVAKQGKRISVYYIGRLKSNNKVFDSMQNGTGFKFTLGAGEVIKGWDVGVNGMKVGGKRRITCPAHMAYGARGHPPSIPPNSTLVFEVELKAVN